MNTLGRIDQVLFSAVPRELGQNPYTVDADFIIGCDWNLDIRAQQQANDYGQYFTAADVNDHMQIKFHSFPAGSVFVFKVGFMIERN